MNIQKSLIQAIHLNLSGDHLKAEKIVKKILKLDAKNPDALRIMGEIYLSQKIYLTAIIFFEKSLEECKDQLALINNLGVCYLELENLSKAKYYFELAISISPNFVDALFNLAIISEKSDDLDSAIKIHQEILDHNSNYISSYHKLTKIFILKGEYFLALKNLDKLAQNNKNDLDEFFFQEKSFCLMNLLKHEEALEAINKSIEINPNISQSYNNRGCLYKDINNFQKAEIDFKKAIEIDSQNTDAYLNLAGVYENLKRNDDALLNYNKTIALQSKNYKYYINRSCFLRNINDYHNALIDANNAIEICKNDETLKVRSDCYLDMHEYELALKDLNDAIEFNPKPSYFLNRGLIYLGMNDFDKCERDYSRKNNTNDILTDLQKFDLSILYLSQGKFKIGWDYYHSRLQRTAHQILKFPTNKPLWNGEKNIGRIYIYNEQGLGDQIIFSSLIPEVLRTGNEIILSVDPRLVQVYKESFNVQNIKIIPKEVLDNKAFPESTSYDCYISLSDLGRIFRNQINDFNNQPKNYLKANINLSRELRARILNNSKNNFKLMCGISWASKGAFEKFKSCELNNFLSVINLGNIEFVNLQYGDIAHEIDIFQSQNRVKINSINELNLFNDIYQLFALIQACDFVITTSNVTAHIAGSIGKKTFLLSPYGPGKIWYWRLFNGKNLWYPSIEVIEQNKPKDWNEPFVKIVNLIKEQFL